MSVNEYLKQIKDKVKNNPTVRKIAMAGIVGLTVAGGAKVAGTGVLDKNSNNTELSQKAEQHSVTTYSVKKDATQASRVNFDEKLAAAGFSIPNMNEVKDGWRGEMAIENQQKQVVGIVSGVKVNDHMAIGRGIRVFDNNKELMELVSQQGFLENTGERSFEAKGNESVSQAFFRSSKELQAEIDASHAFINKYHNAR